MSIKLINILLCSFLFISIGESQSLQAHYNFDACSLDDVTNQYLPGTNIGNSINCACGVIDDALIFTGNETIEFSDLDMSMDGDYTLSFYFWSRSTDNIIDILSVTSDTCNYDSTMHITYVPNKDLVKFEILEHGSRRVNLEGKIDINKCWHHVLLINQENRYDLYVDEKRVETKIASKKFILKPDAIVKISGDPCNTISTAPLVGFFDEFKIWDYALSQEEIQNSYTFPDKIISSDKTIFLGESYQVLTGGICSNNFSWNPNNEIENPGETNPLISPSETNTYILSINQAGCSIYDTINIYVIDPNELDCTQILLPNAFTPNNDGLNETYGISNGFIIEELKSFDIYDRWSNIVFSSTEKTAQWDGSFQDKKLNPGLYIYKITYVCQGKNYNKTGSFSLLR